MDLQLKGKRAIVTGGTAGIGLAIVKAFVAEGVPVVVPGRNLAKLKESLAAMGESVKAVEADVATKDGAAALIREVADIDILVNNLGVYEPKPFAEISDEDWLRIFEVNVLSGVRLARHYFPGMLQRNWGRVIFIASESAIMTPPEMVHYGVTKSSQLAVARGMAELTKGTAVTVNSVLPGPTRSEGIVSFLQSMSTKSNPTPAEAEKEFFEKHRASSLLQRLIESAEVADLVTFLASPLSSATNGAALRVEGGLLRSIA